MSTIRRLPASLSSTAALLLISSLAHAQAKSGEFSVERFEPAPGSQNYLSVEQLKMEGAWGWSAGLVFDYGRNPFVLESCASKADCSKANPTQPSNLHVVQDMLDWNLLASVSPVPMLQIGLRVPLEYNSGDGFDANTGLAQTGGLGKFGIGDTLLEGKVRLFSSSDNAYVLGAAGGLLFPLGHATGGTGSYIGNDSPLTGEIRGIFDGSKGPLSFGANLRGVFREAATVATTTVGPVDFRYGVAAGYRISPVFRALAEGYGSTQFKSTNGTNTLEIDAAAEVRPLDSSFIFKLGGGAGVLEGVGVPQARGIASIMYSHELKDTDGDGIPDNLDKCPTLPEDFDGFEDLDGCPDPDNDKDGIPDEKDKCPNNPETFNGFQDADGCPDELPDRDHDGIPDNLDKCPDAGGKFVIRNPKSQYYGCPDRDNDGIPDMIDKCPDDPEDFDGFEDLDGCPDPDNDHDGIPDEQDECINEPETYNGYQDKDGCPDTVPGVKGNLVEVSDSEIKILQTVEFATATAKITGAKSFLVLDAVAGALTGHVEIAQLEVAGHTDNAGNANTNRVLSQKRAEAVVVYLKSKGVDGGRLVAKGYGPDKPIADNKTPAGKQKNRRVEFQILKSNKPHYNGPDAPTTPAPAAAAAPGGPAAASPPAAPPSGAPAAPAAPPSPPPVAPPANPPPKK